MEQWKQAYHCRMHDVVTLDDGGKVLSPTEFRRLRTGEG